MPGPSPRTEWRRLSQIMKVRTANTILYCARWRECVKFYREGLELAVNFENEWFVEFVLNNATRISIADAARTSIESAGGRGITVTLEVANLEAAHRMVEGRGLVPGPIHRHPWGADVFYLVDPDGHRIEFWSNVPG
ncbi:MAG: VOC family protein [Gammaproteobacteria bacterium]|nr:VOC family protein [Gammaproteobacteria bacterium]